MDNEKCMLLIDLYKERQLLWDPKQKNYHNNTLREDAWKEISLLLEVPVDKLKTKMKSLMGTYRRERSRQKISQITGSGKDSVYVSKWFAFEYFRFLSDRDKPTQTMDTDVDTLNQEEEEVPTQHQSEVENLQNNGNLTETVDKIPTSGSSGLQSTQRPPEQRPQTQVAKKKRTAQNSTMIKDPMLDKAFSLSQKSAYDNTDPYFTYGQHVANELRKYDARTLAYVKQAINNILFEADMGRPPLPNYGYYLPQHISPAYTNSCVGSSTHVSSVSTPLSSPDSVEASMTTHQENIITAETDDRQCEETSDDNDNIGGILLQLV